MNTRCVFLRWLHDLIDLVDTMSGIIITPGTFNPSATPQVTAGVWAFPRPRQVTLRKPGLSYQFATRRRAAGGGGPLPGIMPIYAEYTYVSKHVDPWVRVGVPDAVFDSGKTHFTTAGLRYVPNGTWAKTGYGSFLPSFESVKYYEGVSAPLYPAQSAPVHLGTIKLKENNAGGAGNAFYVDFNYMIALEGLVDGAYSFVAHVGAGDQTATSGTVSIHNPLPLAGWAGEPETFRSAVGGIFQLRRDGLVFDQISVSCEVEVTVEFEEDWPDEPGHVSSGLTIVDTLYGAGAAITSVVPPSLPMEVYSRASRMEQGEVTLS